MFKFIQKKVPPSYEAVEWLSNGERGASSDTMFTHIMGVDALRGLSPSYPLDVGDFRRCRLLLESVPEVREGFPKMRSAGRHWVTLLDHWQELCDLMDREAPDWRLNQGWARGTQKMLDSLYKDVELCV